VGGFILRPTHDQSRTVLVGSLEETDYAYLAGIIDGEGTVGICRVAGQKKGRAYLWYLPELTVSSTDLLMLRSILARFRGHVVKAKTPLNKHWKQGYLLFFRRKETLTLLPKIIQYMTTKRLEAELMLEYMSTMTGGVTAGADGRFVGIPLTERQKQIVAEIRKNDKRGPPI